MPFFEPIPQRRARIENAFRHDGFVVTQTAEKDGCLGAAAEHVSARIGRSSRAKRAFYLEGDNYQMGFLLGRLAPQEISRMTHEFLQKVVFAFFDTHEVRARGLSSDLRNLMTHIATGATHAVLPDIPEEYKEELQGIVDGYASSEPGSGRASASSGPGTGPGTSRTDTAVTLEDLITLNFGIDAILAHVYSGALFARRGFKPGMLKTPIGCNAFFIGGVAAGGACFFGRDFMFPTANIFQETACLIVQRPVARRGKQRLPFVSQTAPGIVGSITGMNSAGVAMGVNMLPSMFCSARRPGFNSLPLVRDCLEYCETSSQVVDRIAHAQRGVTWLYPVADGDGNAYVVEAGRKLGPWEPFPYFTWVPWHYRRRLPTLSFIRRMGRRYRTPRPIMGALARGNHYALPDEYITRWNERLWRAFEGDWFARIPDFLGDLAGLIIDLFRGRWLWALLHKDVQALHQEADFTKVDFAERGYINASWKEKNCPGPFYFAPQRQHRPDVLVATNHAISPEIRLTAMNEWIALLAGGNLNEIQWRYDELSREILDAIAASPSGVTEETAWDLINFLRPNGRFPDFYNPGGERSWADIQVHGSVSLCELTKRKMTSLYGYYGDKPVTVHLGSYIESGSGG